MWKYVLVVEMCDSFSGDCLVAGNKDRCFGAVVVGDGKNGVVSFGDREFNDEVHGNDFKWVSVRVCSDGKEMRFLTVRVDLVGQACSASFDVLLDVLTHGRPPKVA